MSWLNRDGPSLYFERHGDGSEGGGSAPLVLVHGLTCDGTDWERQVDHFRASREVVTVDLRGHGRSLGFGTKSGAGCGPKSSAKRGAGAGYAMEQLGDDVVALLEHLDLRNAVVAGHSMGCRVALHVANSYSCAGGASSRVAGIALVDGSRFAAGSAEDAVALAREQIAQAGVMALAQSMFEQMFTERSDPATAARIIERAVRVPPPILEALMEGRSAWDAARMDGELATLNVPLLALQSTDVNQQGKRVSLAASDSTAFLDLLRTAIPAASIHVVPDTGHFTMIDAPDETNTHLEQFLTQIEAGL